MAYTAESFLAKIKPYVIADMKSSGILASLTAAQAFIESNKGNSGLTEKGNALFGIKATKTWQGKTVIMSTTEYQNGVKLTVNASFRAYNSWAESIADHSAFLNDNKRYKNLRGLTDYKLACKYIKADGYATSPTYESTLRNTIETYSLWLWDLEAMADIGYAIGKTYTLRSNMYVRDNPEGNNLSFDDLTTDGKAHAIQDENGIILRQNTRVTVKEIKELPTGAIWLRIPSGWICGKGESGKIYVA